jgi:hypothetical protein
LFRTAHRATTVDSLNARVPRRLGRPLWPGKVTREENQSETNNVRSLFSNRHNSSATLCNPRAIAQSVSFPPLRYSPTLLPGGATKSFSPPNLVTSSVHLAAPSPRAPGIRGSPRESVRNQSCLLRASDRYAYIVDALLIAIDLSKGKDVYMYARLTLLPEATLVRPSLYG